MKLTLDQALQKGIEAHKAGKVQEADQYYTAILKANPKHPDANHNMGVLAVGIGKVEAALPFFKTALDVNSNIDQFWLSYLDALIKLGRLDDAKSVFEQAKSNGAKGDGFDQIEKNLVELEKVEDVNATFEKPQEPPKKQIQPLIDQYIQGQYQKALDKASELMKQFPNSLNLYNIIGETNQSLGKLDEAIEAYKKALTIKPDYAAAYYNMGNALKEQGNLNEAIAAYKKALSIQPEYADAYYNIGIIFKEIGKLDEAIEAYKKALTIKPNYAEAYNNMGNALQDQERLDEAIEAYTKALSTTPENAQAYNNMGVALLDQGKLDKAIEAYNKALSIKPDYAETHHNLSSIKEYTEADEQFLQAQEYYGRKNLNDDEKCILSFALAKMYEDIGDIDKSFACLTEGNSLRKKILKYSLNQDKELFSKLKVTQPYLLKNALKEEEIYTAPTPIFILGMPRSGTTLVEQIISSHSRVTGAGELDYIEQLGKHLAVDPTRINSAAISKFRDQYLSKVAKLSNGKQFVTDKMPQNFRFIPLIYSAFPKAKIVHLNRSAAATCWSNYKQYFKSNGLGYCYDLRDIISYNEMYKELMKIWQSDYGDRLYHLNYESLTADQENQTRKLTEYLGLTWEAACLSPHQNKRNVRTASQQQVKKKIYRGSSETWRKFAPFLNGAFDNL